jgi:drug/metabolite transporter (DMT)-like permease
MKRFWGYLSVIAATVFFGIATPFDKILLQEMHPLAIAALTYTIAGIFLFSIRQSPLKERVLSVLNKQNKSENYITRKDYIILIVTALSSAFIAPLLYLNGLNQTTAVNASLLVNTEVLFIITMSLILFKEVLRKKDILGMGLLIIGAFYLATKGEIVDIFFKESFIGSLLIIAASFFWSIDTVLSKFLSNKRDLIWIAGLKSSIGGLLLLISTLFLGISLKTPWEMIPILLFVAFLSIGSAYILIYFAIRELGATRVGAIFPLSSLFGAIFAFIILGEPLTIIEMFFGVLMLLGVFILYWNPK